MTELDPWERRGVLRFRGTFGLSALSVLSVLPALDALDLADDLVGLGESSALERLAGGADWSIEQAVHVRQRKKERRRVKAL